MKKITLNSRIAALKLCHNEIIEIGDEEAYEWWIAMGVPDEPSEEDFEWIASKDDEYEEVLRLYKKICHEYGAKFKI